MPESFVRYNMNEKQVAEVVSLRHKLARDGVQLAQVNAIEDALCLNEEEMKKTWEDSLGTFGKTVHSNAGLGLFVNPYKVVKAKKKKRGGRSKSPPKSPKSPKKKRRGKSK